VWFHLTDKNKIKG